MTLYVTREILEAHNVCGNGLINFEENAKNYPNRKVPYQDFLKIGFEVNSVYPDDNFPHFAMELKKSLKFFLMQEYVMTDKYQVFNTYTGQHEPFDSLEAALARRKELIAEQIKIMEYAFSINREIAVGEDTTWVPITDLPTEP